MNRDNGSVMAASPTPVLRPRLDRCLRRLRAPAVPLLLPLVVAALLLSVPRPLPPVGSPVTAVKLGSVDRNSGAPPELPILLPRGLPDWGLEDAEAEPAVEVADDDAAAAAAAAAAA